ncbi:hypothetical protein Leryth_002610 [Lithospermum erythrorhizon]|nr:hypothetical protein Leryth_002610 [Lithospermum erythrorhizon]
MYNVSNYKNKRRKQVTLCRTYLHECPSRAAVRKIEDSKQNKCGIAKLQQEAVMNTMGWYKGREGGEKLVSTSLNVGGFVHTL